MKINVEKIERERKRLNISKIDMSRRLKMSRQAYWDFLKSSPPTLNVLSKIAKILEFDAKDLLK